MKNSKVIGLILALIVLIGGAGFIYHKLILTNSGDRIIEEQSSVANPQREDSETENSPDQKSLAPDFTVYDADGNEYKLSDFRGKPVVINFWASWCGYCKMEMPDFQKKYDEYGQDVQFLMINMTDGFRETQKGAQGYISNEGYTFPVFYDTKMDVSNAYQVTGLPMTFFIDENGYYVAHIAGPADEEILDTGIAMLMNNDNE